MYWAEVTMRDSNTQRFESEVLNEIYALFGKYAVRDWRGTKATEMKFGRGNEQTGFWTPETGLKNI